MASMIVVEAVNDPGKPGMTGDDRYGFDISAGTAWVLDGATDVSDLRPFAGVESGAAWIAETLSELLTAPPWPEDEPGAYWRRILRQARMRAERDSSIPLDDLPLDASPIAAGMWIRVDDSGGATFAWLGDCVAITRSGETYGVIGSPDKADAETAEARRLLALSAEDRQEALRGQRRAQNSPGAWIFGLDPAAADHLHTATATLQPDTDVLLMSDGLFRLISPYQSHTPKTLFELVDEGGLLAAIRALRAQEGAGADNASMGRLKTRDDACGVWLRIAGT